MKFDRKAKVLVLSFLIAFAAGCGDREEFGSEGENGTTVFAPKKGDGVTAAITFCEKVGSKTGKPIGEGTVFIAGEDEKVRALVEIGNARALGERELMFHLMWIDPEGNSFYTKRIDITPEGGEAEIQSAISIPPDKREPGIYTLRVFLFRERIAEKTFELIAP
ncbi:MAG: hypothetical protein ABIK65_16270 [Candidatus Eisenbacteria bacterium]